MARCGHQAQKSTQRMAGQPDRPTRFISLRLRKIGHLLHQMLPVVADRVLRVMAQLLDGLHRKAAFA